MSLTIVAKNTLSLRTLITLSPDRLPEFDALLNAYLPKFQLAYKLAGETDLGECCRDFLLDPEDTWDVLLLRDSELRIVGAIHYQIVSVPDGHTFNNSIWLEHFWTEETDTEEYPNFKELLRIAREYTEASAELRFFEFNNPAKMPHGLTAFPSTPGIVTQDDLGAWEKIGGLTVLRHSSGEIAAYAQPALEDQEEPGNHLSLAFPDNEILMGTTVPVPDYLALCHAAHNSFLESEEALRTYPTVAQYTREVQASSDSVLTFAPLFN